MTTSFSSQAIQSNLFDFSSQEVTNEAVARSGEHAAPEWSKYARVCLRSLCERKQTLTVDDLCALLSRYDVHTHNSSALGAIMRHGAKSGWMKLSGEYKKSDDPKKHSRVLPIWQSLLCP